MNADLVIVGAGLFGLTIAQQAAERAGARVEIIDVRSHIGGNVYSYIDEETGAEIHQYGAHLFHTSTKRVWDYVNRFTAFTDYVHRVYATHDGEVYPLPINLGTINQFFHAHYAPAEAKALIKAGKVCHSYYYEGDRSLKRWVHYKKNQFHYFEKYKRYFGNKGLRD